MWPNSGAFWFSFDGSEGIADSAVAMNYYHGDFGQDGSGDSGTLITGGTDYYIRRGHMPDQLSIPLGYSNPAPTFDGSRAYPAFIQTHLSIKQNDTSVNRWFLDARNPASANGTQNLYGGVSITQVPGFNKVFKVSMAGSLDRKRLVVHAQLGRFLLRDASSPAANFDDNSLNSFCIADFAGECVPGSSAGDVFVNGPLLDTAGNLCMADLGSAFPCVFTIPDGGFHIVQVGTDPDSSGTRYRKISAFLGGLGHEDGFWNARSTPDASWSFASTAWLGGTYSTYLAAKLPPWPADTTPNHQAFRYISVPVSPVSGATQARAKFGYVENEPPGSSSMHFYGTTRQDVTTSELNTDDPRDPFSWMTNHGRVATDCSSGACTVGIPALPGRILYYVIEQLDSDGNVISTTLTDPRWPCQGCSVVAVP